MSPSSRASSAATFTVSPRRSRRRSAMIRPSASRLSQLIIASWPFSSSPARHSRTVDTQVASSIRSVCRTPSGDTSAASATRFAVYAASSRTGSYGAGR